MIKCPACNSINPTLHREVPELVQFAYNVTAETIQVGDDLNGDGLPATKPFELHCRACSHTWPIPSTLRITHQ